ncbi:hypothetical protein [Massilia rubra]|uniref:Uncharacterized protein n=1 Tax=Massilia rubra TaxID=2607910 RepID=A0ABX0LV10_9BURK|nr:hypothetical protein [Massilia rubra]NHZ36091.1 hypothetical protein [Massilia rubra]
MMGQTRHIAHAEGWLAVATESDLCKVGKCIVAFNSFARLDHQYAASPDVKARGTPVYRVGDLFKNTQANAGAHIVSGTSLNTGYLQILEGHSNVKVNAIPVARHDSACRINCDSTGMGGARGRIVTMTKTVAAAVAKPAGAPPGAGARVSKKLLQLKALRDALREGRLNLDAFDGIFDFDRANAVLNGWISDRQGTPGTVSDWYAQLERGALGATKDFVMGIGELAYEAVKGVPKLAREMTPTGSVLASLDRQILAEEISLGNIEAPSITKDVVGMAKALVKPVTDPWMKGQYVEAGTRGGIELFTLVITPIKALRAAQAKKLSDLAKAKDAAAAASAASLSSTTGGATVATGSSVAGSASSAAKKTATAAVGSPAISSTAAVGAPAVRATAAVGTPAVSATATPGTSAALSRGGVYVARVPKRARPPANGYTGPNAYKTHGIVDSPANSPEGRRLVESYTSQGFTPAEAADKASNLMASGSTLPKAVDLAPGQSLYKLVPEGDIPGKYSAFFATKDEMSSLKGMSYDQISDRLGIPLESQQTVRFDVHEVVANRKITVFESTIARTSQNGYLQPGGGVQTLITDRSAFTSPVLIGKLP